MLLLDEVTTDLDVIARGDLLAFLRAQPTTILYATHILEGLEDWATHLAYLDGGQDRRDVADRGDRRVSRAAGPAGDDAAIATGGRMVAERAERARLS